MSRFAYSRLAEKPDFRGVSAELQLYLCLRGSGSVRWDFPGNNPMNPSNKAPIPTAAEKKRRSLLP